MSHVLQFGALWHNFTVLAYQWQSLIVGVFALIPTCWAISASKKKDRSKARSIAAGIAGEIEQLKDNIKRARAIIKNGMPYDVAFKTYAKPIEERIRDLAIVDSPLIRENAAHLSVLGKAGETILELRSRILAHNRLVASIDPDGPLGELDEPLKAMERLVERAQYQIKSI